MHMQVKKLIHWPQLCCKRQCCLRTQVFLRQFMLQVCTLQWTLDKEEGAGRAGPRDEAHAQHCVARLFPPGAVAGLHTLWPPPSPASAP